MFSATLNYAVKAKKYFFFQWKPCTNETDKGESFSISGSNEGALQGPVCASDYVEINGVKYCGGALQNAPFETGKKINTLVPKFPTFVKKFPHIEFKLKFFHSLFYHRF